MTDRAYETPDADPFAQIARGDAEPASQDQQPDPDDPLAALARQDGGAQSSATRAFARGAARSVIPAVGSFPAIGAGAEVGAEVGLATPVPGGALIGGLIGGAAAGLSASTAISKAQNWALSQLPDSWRDKLGLSGRQQQIDEGEHPTASFLGGLVPYAMTMRPGATPTADLPDNATALQRILAHPMTARLFGGAAMGGMELGQEEAEDHKVSWTKAAIATAFGMVFNRPTRFGEKITELGARPARAALGLPSPTLAQAGDAKVMGPGVTEDVFQGAHAQDPVAEGTAQETARQEQATVGPIEAAPDLHDTARRMNPELFAHYDDLLERQKVLQGWLDEQGPEAAPVATQHLDDANKALADIAPEVSAAYRRAAEATGAPTVAAERFPTMAAMLAAQGTEGAPGTPGAAPEAPARTIEQQRDYIRDDVSRQLVAAGRPPEEAQAAGALVAARYEARASRFNGALGTPEDLYRAEAPEIRGAKPPATGGAAPAAQPRPEPPAPTALEEALPEEAAVTAPASRRGAAYRDQNTFSLLEFLAAHGGIRSDDPLAADLRQSFGGKNKFLPGFGQLIRKPNGNRPGAPLSLDQARQAAVDAGYIQDAGEISRGVTQSNIEDLLQAVDKEARGEKIYRQGAPTKTPLPDVAEANVREREAFIQGLNDYAKDHLALTPAEHARALELFDKEGIHEAAEIVDRLALEIDNREIESGNAGPRDEAIPGWDVPHEPAAAPGTGETVAPGEPTEPGRGGARIGGEGAGAPAEEVEYFQRKPKDLIAEREAEGQEQIPGAERISDAELAQRKANEPLKPSAAQEPLDIGLFGDGGKQRELFQIAAFHGSPHDFDRFDLSRVGSGEGAQVFGHGLYFAENQKVAEGYQKKLAGARIHSIARNYLLRWNGNVDKALAEFDRDFRPVHRSLSPAGQAENDAIRSQIASGGKGALYQVKINAEPEHFLDWDKPLNQQSEFVQKALDKIPARVFDDMQNLAEDYGYNAPENGRDANFKGSHLYKYLKRLTSEGPYFDVPESEVKTGTPDEEVSLYLRQLGIGGVRYLDQGSRGGAAVSESTHNYVLFNDKDVEISHKNGSPVNAQERADYIRELYQRQNELSQTTQGKIRLEPNKRPIITLAKTADASTFIHETGHAWLEELMRDANHPQAPGDVKADADTVLNWLGAEKPDAITTRQHEKFARGFEQYLREGVAPSPGLAAVFAKFRDWLLRIYQTLRGLGPEISPDIRSVFDRMLAAEPQRTVIAPERMSPPTLADIHEADAAHTEPAEAHAAGDRVLAEADRFAHDLPGAIQNAHAAAVPEEAAPGAIEPGSETPLRPEPAGQVQPGGGEPGPAAAGGAGGAQPGAQLRGGNAAVPEGAGPRGGGERPGLAEQSDAALGDKPLAPRPAEQVGRSDAGLVDKAGNIRRDNLNAPDDIWRAIKESAASNNDFIGDRRGVVTTGQTLQLADDIGMSGAENIVANWVRGQALNAEQVVALSRLVKQQSSDVGRLSQLARTQPSDENTLKYATEKARLDMILRSFAGATAEAGRTLHAFRNMKGDLEQAAREAGTTLFQIRRDITMSSALDTPQKIAKFAQDSQKYSFGRMILEYWINGLISGPATHATYMIGNTLLALEKAGPETAAAAAIGSIRKALGRPGETVRMGEVAEQFKAGARSMAPAVKAALDAFRTGTATTLPGEQAAQNILRFPGTELAEPAAMDEAAKFSDVMASGFSIVRGMRDGIIAGGELAKAAGTETPNVNLRYSHLGAIPDIELRGMNLLPLGTAIRLPSRFIAAIHSFFRAVNYSMEKNRIAYRTAANEDLQGAAFEARVGDLRQNPTDAMMEQARGEATELTLMGQGGAITQALSRLVNTPVFGFPLLKFIDPFVHISSNIINKAIIERTPLGILSPEIRADLSGKNGNVAQDTASARMLMGTVYAVTLGGLAAEGYISGSEPADPKQAAVWRLAGNQAHSVRIGDMWYDVHRLGPLGMLMGVAADMQSVSHALSDGDLLLAGSNLQHAITQNILDESFMRGPADLIQAIEDPARYGEYYLRDQLSSFVPFSVGMAQLARAADPYSRQARTVMDTIRDKVPFESQNLLPRRDIWGDEIANKPAVGAAGLTAIYEQRINNDPVNQALLQLGIYPAQVTRKIRNVQLTDQQYDDYQRIAGRMTKMRLDAIVRSPDYATWPDHIKATVIRETIKGSRTAAEGVMFMKYPTIPAQATLLRRQKVSGD